MDISVIITCYNRADRIADAVQSALDQELSPREIVVIDDGSTDDSPRILESFGDRIRVIRTPNRGLAKSLNLGLRESKGEWVAFLDSDDVWDPRKLRLQAAALQRFPEAVLAFCDIEAVRGETIEIPSRFALGGVYEAEVRRDGDFLLFDRSLFLEMIERSRIFTSSAMVRRDLPELRFREDFRCCTDWPTWMNLVPRYPFAAVDKVLLRMNYDGDNITSRVGRVLRNDVIVLEDLLRDPILSDNEHTAVEQALRRRRVGAMYHSLVEGEPSQARRLLSRIPAASLGSQRWLTYWLASWSPAFFLRWVARKRLQQSP